MSFCFRTVRLAYASVGYVNVLLRSVEGCFAVREKEFREQVWAEREMSLFPNHTLTQSTPKKKGKYPQKEKIHHLDSPFTNAMF